MDVRHMPKELQMSRRAHLLSLLLVLSLTAAACANNETSDSAPFADESSQSNTAGGEADAPSGDAAPSSEESRDGFDPYLTDGDLDEGSPDTEALADEGTMDEYFPLDPDDEKCKGYEGDLVDSCTTPESARVSAGPDGTANLEVLYPLDSPEIEVTIEFVANDSDELLLIDCSQAQGCTTFYGPGLENVDSTYDIDFSGTDSKSGTFLFGGIPLTSSSGGDLLLSIPGGTTSSGAAVPDGLRIITEVIVYSDETVGDPMTRLQGVTTYPTSQLASGLVDLDPDILSQP